jgi:hypothetical protein
MKRNHLDLILTGVILICFVGLAGCIWVKTDRYQQDFDVYYHSAQAYSQGHNPYNSQELSHFIPSSNLSFVYPPITLFILRIFILMDYGMASHLFLGLKCLALLALLLLWKKYILEVKSNILFLLFCFLGFYGAVCTDLMTGNISIFEQLLIWIAFITLLKRKLILFGFLIVITSIFKIIPILFLFLLLFQDDRRKYQYFTGFILLFISIMSATYFLFPELFSGFITNSFRATDIGIINPTNHALITYVIGLWGRRIGAIIPEWIPIIISTIIAILILLISLRAFKKLSIRKIYDGELVAIFLACLVYALILPRFKDYSYILLLPPAYFIIAKMDNLRASPFLYVIIMLATPWNRNITVPGIDPILEVLWDYYPLLLAYFIWALYLYYIGNLNKSLDVVLKSSERNITGSGGYR